MASPTQKIPLPVFIDNQHDFEGVIESLRNENILAVDTEANSLFAYQEQVCLIQISTSRKDYILDPLSLDDISPLGDLFSSSSIEKVFHASEYDILIMRDDFQFEFQNLFDTMLAAQILGREKLGLDSLLHEIAGIKVNKKYQRADWGKRPLTDDMLRYAQMDTHYLIKIRDALSNELETAGLTPIAEEDFRRACRVQRNSGEEGVAACWKISGARKLSPQEAAVLNELCEYRDTVARKRNVPVFKVISSAALLQLAEESPRSVPELLKLNITGGKAIKRHADGLINAILAGLKAKPVHPPKRVRLDDLYLAREKALRDWRKVTAQKMKVNSAVVLPREIMHELVTKNPSSADALSRIMDDVPWRLEKFGDQILNVINKANVDGY